MKADPSLAVLLAALATSLHCLAASEGAGTPPLNLRVPPAATTEPRPSPTPPERQRPTLRLEPRKSLIERGVEGSREALIACQNGAYPGATVAAQGVQVSGGDSQRGIATGSEPRGPPHTRLHLPRLGLSKLALLNRRA